eukprot:scaffold27049_cov64-Phaeocystis_antarctica.AAC.2
MTLSVDDRGERTSLSSNTGNGRASIVPPFVLAGDCGFPVELAIQPCTRTTAAGSSLSGGECGAGSCCCGGGAEGLKKRREKDRENDGSTVTGIAPDVLDRRLHHHVARGRVEEDRDRVGHGVADTAPKLPDAIATRRELGSQRRHRALGQLVRQREQQWLDLGKVVAAAHHVDAHEGVALPHGLKELQQPHRVTKHALGLQQHDSLRRRVYLAAPRVDIVAADDHLALQLVLQLTLQQPRRPTTLVTRTDDQQPPISVAWRLSWPAQAPQKPLAEVIAQLLSNACPVTRSTTPGTRCPGIIRPFRLSPPEGQSALVNQRLHRRDDLVIRSPGLPRDDAQPLLHLCVVRRQPRGKITHVLFQMSTQPQVKIH